jgi:hypothetical protein
MFAEAGSGLGRGEAAHEDHWNIRAHAAEFAERLNAIEPGHGEIEQDEIDLTGKVADAVVCDLAILGS